ncbi:hypothetical protein D9753_00095 (plasmid) [Streptomyces dangxiongensis]|uniref:SseB protein N-terminal domain-containing protein n=1 Tax=Streptomyces dangxiongensis TaxID=1442032 RepID=A0A3G2JAW5_9ACTN|nr:hypothetical protein [Streptomyces dangxiongensis]AYN37672.1 hypothetical protein D9753_00095 [Streptomyces dangxiongensis]
MSEHGGAADWPQQIPRSRIADYAEMTTSPTAREMQASSGKHDLEDGRPDEQPPVHTQESDREDAGAETRRREFAALLGEFRRTPVLVPLGDGPGPEGERGLLTADLGGVRFILAFSDVQALARYAVARGEAAREWSYQTVLGARLLDVAVPAAGVPCGVALDCADGEEGMVFPPVRGIVPDEVAVDFASGTGEAE